MDQSHITEDELRDALANYRWALGDALRELGTEAERAEVIARARVILAEEEPEQQALIVELADGDFGDPVWSLEEELLDD